VSSRQNEVNDEISSIALSTLIKLRNVCKPPPLSTIAIIGAGAVGLATTLAAKLTSPSILVLVENKQSRLDMIPEGLVTTTLNSADLSEDDLAAELRRLTNGVGFNFVVECAGISQLVNAGHKALAPRGTLVTVGGGAPTAMANISLVKQLIGGCTYRGTHQGDSVPQNVSHPNLRNTNNDN
jgi:aryl-alcohol dehydrogenase